MVVGVARVVLASLLLMVVPNSVQAGPAYDAVGPVSEEVDRDPYYTRAVAWGMRAVANLTDTIAADPVGFATDLTGVYEVGPVAPGDVRTAKLELFDLSTSQADLPVDQGEDEIQYTRTTRDGDRWCLHLLEGAPLQPDGPAQSLCLRDPMSPGMTPGLVEGVDSWGTNMVVYGDRKLEAIHVAAAVSFTYDCTQMEAPKVTVGGDTLRVYSPFSPFEGNVLNGALGYLVESDGLPAVFEVTVVDEGGEVTSSQTTVPGLGHLIAYALFMQQQQAGENSDLCADV
jgi:hypothetical protein